MLAHFPKDKFNLQVQVIKEIQRLVDEKGLSYIEATIEYAETIDLDVDSAAEIIKKIPFLQARIQEEAEALNILPKTGKLL